jgi:hypothetical protein
VCKAALADVTPSPAADASAAPAPATIGLASPAAPDSLALAENKRRAVPPYAATPSGNAAEPPLVQRASAAWQSGQCNDAVQLALAAYLTHETNQAVSYQWVPALRRPATALRYGVGIDFVGADAANVRKQLASIDTEKQLDGGRLSAVLGDIAAPIFGRLALAPVFLPPPCQLPPAGASRTTPQVPVQFLGLGDRRTVIRAALQRQVDVLLMFDVEEKTTRNSQKSKTVVFTLLDTWNGRELIRSREVNYLKRQLARAEPLYEDPLEKIVAEFDRMLSDQLRPEPLPAALRSEQAARRVGQLARMNHLDRLAVLGEIHFYRELELISVQQTIAAFEAVLGSGQGGNLLAGTTTERRLALDRWIPKPLLGVAQRADQRAVSSAEPDE